MSRSRSNAALKLADAAPVFAALGDPTRVGLVARLCVDGPLSITRLSEGSRVTRQAVTKQLRTLGKAGLVRNHRRGRETIWELEPKRLEKARRSLDMISSDWDAAINRLKAFVEDDRNDDKQR
jgi:DNA-binding transcriptional ArsR family regulator